MRIADGGTLQYLRISLSTVGLLCGGSQLQGEDSMKRGIVVAIAIVTSPWPLAAHAQTSPGFYIGVEGGANWLLNNGNLQIETGFAAGGVVGYEGFVRGLRLELEGIFRSNVGHGSFTTNGVPSNSSTVCTAPPAEFLPPACTTTTTPGSPGSVSSTSGVIPQLAFMLNGIYDFLPGATVTPFIGAGVGIAIEDGTSQLSSTQFAYQAILGVAWNITPQVRLSLDTRYFGTTNPGAYTDNNITTMLSISYKFAPSAAAAAPPPPALPPVPQPQAPSVMDLPIPRVKG
jgi:OOP family OmpA-OmpF porin